MSENISNPEIQKVTKEQAIAVFQQFLQQGITNPDDLPLDDPDVIEANKVLDAWSDQFEQSANASPDPAAKLDFNLVRSTFYIDAGFTDPVYIDEVANDWLAQDLESAEDEGLSDVADRIRAKIEELNKMLPEEPQPTDVNLEAEDFGSRPDVIRDRPLIVSCNLYEASALYGLLLDEAKKATDDQGELQQAAEEIQRAFEELNIKRSPGGLTWSIPSKRSAEVAIFKLPPAAALRTQQRIKPFYIDQGKKAAQALYRNVYDQVSRPQEGP